MEKKTAGQIATELMQQDLYGDIRAGDRMYEMLGEFEHYMLEAINSGKDRFSGDFFIVVLFKRERLMQNYIRAYFIPRKTCPTPSYDQNVYHYHRKDENLEFIWSIPAVVAIKNLLVHMHELDASYYPLLQFVLDFLDGKLEKRAQILNNEPLEKKEMVHDGRIEARGNAS